MRATIINGGLLIYNRKHLEVTIRGEAAVNNPNSIAATWRAPYELPTEHGLPMRGRGAISPVFELETPVAVLT